MWSTMSCIPPGNAIHLLEKNPDKADWLWLSLNINAMHLLQQIPSKINWRLLSSNASIFIKTVNYKFLYQRMNIIREELMMKCMHLSRLERWVEMGGDIDDF